MPRCTAHLLALGLCALGARIGQADIFVLHSGGQVRGELLNKDESPRTSYHIKTSAGGTLSLESDQVKGVIRQSATELQYDRIRSRFADTVEGQREAAEWCRNHRLTKQRKAHLERIIELDSEDAEARRALGFVKIQGRWITQNEHMQASGYVRYGGAWRYPQEVELLERQQKEKIAQAEWLTRIRRWNGWLTSDKAEQARANIAAIQDPYAVKALSLNLNRSTVREVKLLYIEALTRIGTPEAMDTLVDRSINDRDEEVRLACLERIATRQYAPATKRYVQALKAKENPIVNLAAVALAHMKDRTAVGPLIDALVTEHKFILRKDDPRQMSSTFSTDPSLSGMGGNGSFSFGGGAKSVKIPIHNRDVLDALIALTGQNFNYEVKDWKVWFAAQKKPQNLSATRRD